MASDLKGFITDIVKRSFMYSDNSELEGRAIGLYTEMADLMLSYALRGLIPVIVNIMVMSIPRFLFIVSVFNEYKILTMKEQSEVMMMVMNAGLSGNMNISDDDFSKTLLECVQRYKEKKERTDV